MLAWAQPLDIHTADAASLTDVMAGIVPRLAMSTADYRAKFGIFGSVYEPDKFKGIGVVLIEKNRNAVVVDTDLKSGC